MLGNFGIVKNAGDNTTYVTLEASFRTFSTLAPGDYTVKCKIGGLDPIDLKFKAVVNPIINGTNETVSFGKIYFQPDKWLKLFRFNNALFF